MKPVAAKFHLQPKCSNKRPSNGIPIAEENFAAASNMAVARLRSFLGKDRKSTRLNSSHLGISYAVFCLKKKKPVEGSQDDATAFLFEHFHFHPVVCRFGATFLHEKGLP